MNNLNLFSAHPVKKLFFSKHLKLLFLLREDEKTVLNNHPLRDFLLFED